MREVTLNVTMRELKSKGELGKYRAAGKIPLVIYGKGEKNLNGLVDAKELEKILSQGSSGNTIFNLKIGNDTKKAIIKDIQIDVVKRNPVHVDFQVVSMASKIEVTVPVKLVGEAPGVKLHGGILEHFIREIKVKCLPKDIPSSICVDISALEIGKGIVVGDLPKIEGVEYHADAHAMVVNVVAPKKEEVAAPAEGAVSAAAAVEPEVISKGKKEEVAEGAAEAKPKEQK